MIQIVIVTSIKIVFMWGAMRSGMVLFPLRWLIDRLLYLLPVKAELLLRKPLYECIFCMSSIWGIIFTIQYLELSWQYLTLLFAIGGLNYIIEMLIKHIEGEK